MKYEELDAKLREEGRGPTPEELAALELPGLPNGAHSFAIGPQDMSHVVSALVHTSGYLAENKHADDAVEYAKLAKRLLQSVDAPLMDLMVVELVCVVAERALAKQQAEHAKKMN